MSQQLSGVTTAQGTRDVQGLDATAKEPGALTMFQDGEVVYTGDGSGTPNQVCARAIELTAQQDAEMRPFVGLQDANTAAARQALAKNNQHLRMTDPNSPVPRGEQFYVQTSDLKKLLAPFAKNLDKLREFVAASADGGFEVGGSNKFGGNVRSKGLPLPIDR